MHNDLASLQPAPLAPARPTLLVVDDEPTNLRLLNDLFCGDYKVLVATAGERALALCAAEQPHLVLLDVLMPGMNGHEVCRQLKANPLTQDIPVIFITGQTDPEQETIALALGGADFIAKPFNVSVVRARVELQLTLHRQRRELQTTVESLRISQAQAEAANRATNDFLSAISHELRTPLTSIRGFAELLELRLTEDTFRRQAGLIRRAAEHLHQLLSELLDLSKLEAGAMAVLPEPLSLHQLVQDTGEFFQITASAKGLELQVRVDAAVPALLMLDGMRVKQILNNLLSNAFKFTPTGRISLNAHRQGAQLTVQVSDTGPGIAPELHTRIFEKFKQAGPEVANKHGGTGLGLALSRGLAERMGGTLSVQSAPEQGSCFTLTLPLEEPTDGQP